MKCVSSGSKLRSEIRNVQSKLKVAIQSHQMIVFKLKDRPVSIKLRVQMCNLQRHIVSLGEQQKKLLTQLRNEMELRGEAIQMEQKPNIKALQNLRPNPMNAIVSPQPVKIKKEPVIKSECLDPDECTSVSSKPEVVSHSSRRKSKLVATSDELTPNGHSVKVSSSPSHKENTPSGTPSSSPTHVTNKPTKQSTTRTPKQENALVSSTSDESQDAYVHLPADPELRKKLQFMTALSLVTREVLTELQNRRTERKRRSTANPQFMYGNSADQKRKKTIYLSSSAAGVVPLVNTPVISEEQTKSAETSVCLSCSASDGSTCCTCQKAVLTENP